MTTSPSELDRLSTLWETERDKLTPELRAFVCRAVMFAMEKWNGIEPPKPRSIFVEAPSKDECVHVWQNYDDTGTKDFLYCPKCGSKIDAPTWENPTSLSFPHPVSPFAGGNIG